MNLKLLDNSYIFINESITNARRAKRHAPYWAFGILHLIQGLELLLKHLLETEHPSLIYENVDNQRNTVTLKQALERLNSITSIDIGESELKIIRRASSLRNKIVHHEYELNSAYFRSVYLQLFEFTHHFHVKHLNSELHDNIHAKLWRTEAELLAAFKQDSVTYRGRVLPNDYPLEIVSGQRYNGLRVPKDNSYVYYKRHRLGHGPDSEYVNASYQCEDCAVEFGELHIPYCDLEQCPICCGQLLSCKCIKDFWIVSNEDAFEPRNIELERKVKEERNTHMQRIRASTISASGINK